jgi:tetratricopeptide (TPR) repeat protein
MKPGNLLRNRYRIEKALAIGGFGETYLAIDLDYPSQRQVVVKQLKPAQSDPATLAIARRLFESEAQVLADLGESSDRLPSLYAYFEEQGEFYLVQEFIAGQTLTMDLAGRKLSESQTIEILREILASLQVVHGKNKIHRDLKPDNIMRRTQDGKLVLIDFGAVKEVRQATNLGQNLSASIGIGTAGYMPTEQAIGFPRLASDVYAVGAIGIQCLTGEKPQTLFDEDALALRWQHLCRVSSGLAAVLEKMVAQQVNGRYRDGMEAAKEIEKLTITPPPAAKVVPKPSSVVTLAPAPSSDLPELFLKFFGGVALFSVSLLVGVFWLTDFFIPKAPSINNLSTNVASLPSSTTPPSTANSGNNNRNLTKSELENKKKKIANYDRAISINPKNVNAYINRGVAKHELGNKQAAIADFDRAISIAPKNAMASYNRGVVKYQLGKKQEAITDFDRAISLDPKNAMSYYNRGLTKYKLGNKQEAIADYDIAISINPKNTIAYNSRGNAKSALGNKQAAIADYDRAISIDPKYAMAYNNRGFSKYELGKNQEAIADYNRAIYIDPKNAKAYNNRDIAKSAVLENKKKEIADYDIAIFINPKNTQAYYNRGLAKSELGNKQEAIADFDKAISIDPKHAMAYYNRDITKYELENKKKEMADYDRAISIDPKNAQAYYSNPK